MSMDSGASDRNLHIEQNATGDRNQTTGQVLGGMVIYVSGGQAIINTGTKEQESEEESVSLTIGPNPYKGLMAFQETDGDRFFGREEQVAVLWEKLRSLHEIESAIRVLPIYGPSGSGKSSLARAGLIPELARYPIPGYDRARVAILVPGTHPLESLATVLARIVTQDLTPVAKTREFAGELKQANKAGEYDGLRRIADVIPDIATAPLIVLVDQFEEVYTLCKDKTECDAFIGNLLHAAGDRAKRVTVIVTLRSDFLGETQKSAVLNRLFSEQGYLVPAMTPVGLHQAIAKPAELAGHPLDTATIDLLVKDTEEREGALPLLQFALTRIWEGLAEGKQPAETLKAIGGVGGALAGEAQRIYDALGEEEKAIARRLFLGLVQLGEGTKDTRRRASLDSLIAYQDQLKNVKQVIQLFAAPSVRLITLSADDNTETAEVTHEALFDHWQQLQKWLDGSRSDIRFQRRVDEAARYWDKQEQPEGLLWRSPDLDSLKEFQSRAASEITELQLAFYQASVDAEEQERQVVLQREQEKKHQRNLLTKVLAGGLILAAGLGSFAWLKAQEATRNLQEVQLQNIRTLTQTGKVLLRDGQEFEALLTTMEAGQAFYQLRHEGKHALLGPLLGNFYDAIQRTTGWRDYYSLDNPTGTVSLLAFSSDDQLLATGSYDGVVKLWRVSDGRLITSLDNHTASVKTLAFSSDNQVLATGSVDSTVKLWRVKDGSLITSLDNHTGVVWALAFSSDNQVLATGSGDGTVKLWRISDGHLITSLDDHTDQVTTLAFSSDNQVLATGSVDGTVKLWRVSDGHLITSLDDHAGWVKTLAFSSDNQVLATGSVDGTVKLWRVSDGHLITSLDDHAGWVKTLAFSSDNQVLATGSVDGTVKLWRVSDGRIIISLDNHTDRVTTLAFSSDDQLLATGSDDDTVKLWRVSDGSLITSLDHHTDRVTTLAFSSDDQVLATGSVDGTVKLWRVSDGSLIPSLDHTDQVNILALSASNQLLATGSDDGTVKLWRVGDGSLITSLDNHTAPVWTLAFSSDNQLLATGSADGTVKLWRVSDGSLITSLDNHTASVWTLAFSSDNQLLATGSVDSTVKLWRVSDSSLITSLDNHTAPVWTLAFSSDNQLLATGSADGTVKLWRVSDGSLITSLDNHTASVWTLAFSSDNQLLATGSVDSTVKLWRVSDSSLITSLDNHTDSVWTLAFSSDNQLLATGSYDGTVKLWRVSDGSLITSLDDHTDSVRILTFSSDDQLLATGSDDGTVKLWRVSDGSLITSLDDHTDSVWTLAFSSDDRVLVTGSYDGTAKMYSLDLDMLMRYSCEWVGAAYIRNNPNMERRRDICDGFEPEEND